MKLTLLMAGLVCVFGVDSASGSTIMYWGHWRPREFEWTGAIGE